MSKLSPNLHPLLTQSMIETLNSKQITTVLEFIKADTQKIIKIARLNFKETLAIKNFLTKKFSAPLINGFDCYKTTLNNTAILPTGIKGVDNLLEGGLFTGNIYELCGLPAVGKTQFVLTLIKNVISATDLQVFLIDTKSDFSAKRMERLFQHECKQKEYLSRIFVSRCYTRSHLLNELNALKQKLDNEKRFRLIIIDSLASVILNSNDSLQNNADLNYLANVLKYIAKEHHVAFFITNLITTWQDADQMQQELVETVACGKYWASVANIRLKIEKHNNQCKLSLLKDATSCVTHIAFNSEGIFV